MREVPNVIKNGFALMSENGTFWSSAKDLADAISLGARKGQNDFFVYEDGEKIARIKREYGDGKNGAFFAEPLTDVADILLEKLPGGKLGFLAELSDDPHEDENNRELREQDRLRNMSEEEQEAEALRELGNEGNVSINK